MQEWAHNSALAGLLSVAAGLSGYLFSSVRNVDLLQTTIVLGLTGTYRRNGVIGTLRTSSVLSFILGSLPTICIICVNIIG